ncbi:hypothetical protein RvY_11827-2 [Ramazzottius varieornatus]|uniref:Endonuclease/exonuclease/phosphatase domain-containing protein n=1 Tax=Ramazzottius varieornatus TaxID=947166 RepID=A0A1D1VHC3_RAMVA|nr:hypothetical protein RvY_11827-2 [Ramazzottius varieornatus]
MERIRSHLRRNILMLGDFNCSNISWSDKASGSSERERDLLSLQSEFRLWQKVRQITRERGKSCSSLELVFVSQLGHIRNVRTIEPPAATNDHHGLQFFLMLMTPKFVVKSRKQWKVDNVSSTEFRRMLASVDWNDVFDVHCNADVAVSVFQEKFLSATSSCFQLRTVVSRRLLCPFLSATVVEYLRKCRGAYQKWRKTEDQADQTAWKALEARKKGLKTSIVDSETLPHPPEEIQPQSGSMLRRTPSAVRSHRFLFQAAMIDIWSIGEIRPNSSARPSPMSMSTATSTCHLCQGLSATSACLSHGA